METVHYLRTIVRLWWLVLLTVVAGGAGGFAVYYTTTPLYQSSVRMIVSGAVSGPDRLVVIQQAGSLAGLAGTPPAVQDAVHAAGYPNSTPVVTATADGVDAFVTIQVVDKTPQIAQAVANAYVKSLPVTGARLEGGGATPVHVGVISPAELPSKPFAPNPTRDVGLGLAAGLILGVAVALTRDAFNRAIRDSEELERLTGLIVLGTIPHDSPKNLMPITSDPRGSRAEAYRQVRTSVMSSSNNRSLAIAVTSASSGEGKTSVATNVAAAFSRAGHRVALIDADLRRPRVADYLGVDDKLGLTDVLSGSSTLAEALVILDDGRFAVLTSGRIPANPSEALGGVVMEQILRQLAMDYEYVFLDTPPVLPVADALVLAPKVDAVMFVVRLGRTTREQVKHAMAAIARVNADILGIVPNQAGKGSDADYRYRYRYAYSSKGMRGDSPAVDIAPEALQADSEPNRRFSRKNGKSAGEVRLGGLSIGTHRHVGPAGITTADGLPDSPGGYPRAVSGFGSDNGDEAGE